MKIHTKMVLLGAMIVGLAASSEAGSLTFSSGGSNMSNTWGLQLPAGAMVHSLVTATVGSSSNPAWYWGGGLPGGYWQTWTVTTSGGTLTASYISPMNYYGSSPGNPQPSSASAQAGLAGPPAGVLHIAITNITDVSSYSYDEKWSYNLVGGYYNIWHGGGVSGNGGVTAYTEVSW